MLRALRLHVHLHDSSRCDDLRLNLVRLRLHEIGELLRCAPVAVAAAQVTLGGLDVPWREDCLDLLVERLDGGRGRALGQDKMPNEEETSNFESSGARSRAWSGYQAPMRCAPSW